MAATPPGEAAEATRPVRRRLGPAWVIPGVYAALSAAWIYGSDTLVAAIAGTMERQRAWSVYKGFGFVAVTALLLHLGVRWALGRQRAAARRVEESEALLRAVTDAIPDPVFLKARDGRWLFANPATLAVVGKRLDQLIGRTDREIYEDASVAEALMETDRRIMERGQGEVVEERIQTPAGYRTFLSTKAPYRDAAGHVVGLIGNARDITDRKRAEQELLLAEERFQQAQRMESVGRLAGGVAHDFNNLLTVILGAGEALAEALRAGPAASREDVAQIRAAGERARELTGQLLAFARKQVTSPVPLQLDRAVRASERLLARVLGEDVALRLELEPGVWPVRCDPGQVEQVLLNLAVNARDAMPLGGTFTVSVRTAVVDEAAAAGEPGLRAGDWVVLAAEDSGAGISPEVLPHVFEPFFTTKPKGAGTGLGLATVHGIAAQAGGLALARSEPGRGARFEVWLPRHLGAPEAPSPPPAPVPQARGAGEVVLVVEDDPLVREMTARALRAGGYRVLVASSGEEALEIAARATEPPRLLLTDVVMPGLDGHALAEALSRRVPGLRVLYVSGYSQDVISHRGVLDAGVELLAKPFTSGALLARVRALLERG